MPSPSPNSAETCAFGSGRHHAVADLADDPRLGRILERLREADAVEPHRRLALQEEALRLVPVEAGHTLRAVLREQRLVHLRRVDRLGRVGHELAVGVDERAAVAQQEARPDRHVGVLEPARDEAGDALGRIVEARRGVDHLGEGLRIGDALRVEQLLVVIDDPRIEVERQAVDAAVGLRRVGQPALREIGEVEVRIDERLVGHHRPDVVQPLVLAEQPLLHVIRDRDHVEARVARVELDDGLLPLLLLGDHLGADGDAGQVLEFLVILGEQVAARALDQEHLDLLALEASSSRTRPARARPVGPRREWRRARPRRRPPATGGAAASRCLQRS